MEADKTNEINTVNETNTVNEANVTRRKKRVYYRPSIERLRLILMFFMCIDLFGLPTAMGDFVKIFFGFVPIAFFMLSGYLVLRKSEGRTKRILRAITRTAIVFLVLTVFYLALNYYYYRLQGMNIFDIFGSKRFLFNFLVMNVWQFDIGTAIWYVQSLLYAYIIIYFLEKFNLLRFDWIIAAVLIALTVCCGELSGIIKWNIAGYTYLPGNFFTRALPYILLGGFIHRKMDVFIALPRKWYRIGILCGFALMLLEVLLLGTFNVSGYYGHLLGMPVVAGSVCMLTFKSQDTSGFEAKLKMSRWHINCIYYLCQPVSIALLILASFIDMNVIPYAMEYMGILTFLICFGIAWLIALIGRTLFRKKTNG